MLSNASALRLIDEVASYPISGFHPIPIGCPLMHDMRFVSWPANANEGETDPDMLFEIEVKGGTVTCTAPGFGARDDYRSGSILIKLEHWKKAWSGQ